MWKLIVWALQWNINSSVFLKCQYHGAGLRRWCGGLTLELSRRGETLVNRKYLSNQPGLISEVDKMGCCWLPAADSYKPSSTSLPLRAGVFPEAAGRSLWTRLPFPFPPPVFAFKKWIKEGTRNSVRIRAATLQTPLQMHRQTCCTGSSSWQAATLLSKQSSLEEQLILEGKPAACRTNILAWGELRPCTLIPSHRST